MLLPDALKTKLIARISQAKQRKFMERLRWDILDFYGRKTNTTAEEQEVVDYIKSNPVTIFPYDFQQRYKKESIVVFEDEENRLKYVLHDGKRLYFKRSASEHAIRSLYHGLQLDQDANSPHLYLTEDFNLNANDVIADIGAAEGNFSLSNVEKVKKIHLFEYDPEWIEALEATFKPWKDKVEIHHQFVSNTNSEKTISVDSFTKMHTDVSFFKVDIEGEEARFLEGATHYLQSQSNLKMAICTYHKQQDEKEFTQTLSAHGFGVNPSKRYMIFYHDQTIAAPFLRRGLIRATKTTNHG
jgi:hypothetical protein